MDTFCHTLSRKQNDFRGKIIENKTRVLILSRNFVCNIRHTKKKSKNILISNLKKIRTVGAELFHADGQTDRQNMTKLRVAFHNFTNAPKKQPHGVFRETTGASLL